MQKILWVGKPYFAESLRDCGFEEVKILPSRTEVIYSWQTLVREGGFAPDILVVADSQNLPFVLGMEAFPCLTVFYSVQSHLRSWHGPYAQAFDLCLTAQDGPDAALDGPFLPLQRICHCPPFAQGVGAERPRDIDCLVEPAPSPGRQEFIDALSGQTQSLTLPQSGAAEQYGRSRIVVQHTGRRMGINFRTFQAMAAGACVVAPRVNHGLEKLFVDGEHLVEYAPRDAKDAAYCVNFLRANPELVEHIAKTGREEVLNRHLARHRAWTFTDQICDLAMQDPEEIVRQRVGKSAEIRRSCLTVPYLLCARLAPTPIAKEAFETAAYGKFHQAD